MSRIEWTFPKRAAVCAAILFGTVAATAGPLVAQEADFSCGDRPYVVSRLAEAYGETRQSFGIGYNNSLVEVFASDETGTWTITVTLPDGQTCMIASGDAFETLEGELLPIPGSDA